MEHKVQRFKIGYSHTPHTRFYRRYDGGASYADEYNYMVLLAGLPTICLAGMLESCLIHEFKNVRKTAGIANIKKGGDNIVGCPPGFVYVVLMDLQPVTK